MKVGRKEERQRKEGRRKDISKLERNNDVQEENVSMEGLEKVNRKEETAHRREEISI